MSILGNIIWLIFGGIFFFLLYFAAGLLMCITIIGIPFGVQLWKIAFLALCPFGQDVVIMGESGCLSVVFNILWIACGWWEIALLHLFFAAIFAITIIGIPFAAQHFKLIKLSLVPFGSKAV